MNTVNSCIKYVGICPYLNNSSFSHLGPVFCNPVQLFPVKISGVLFRFRDCISVFSSCRKLEHEFRPEVRRPARDRAEAGREAGGQLEASPKFVEKAVEHLSAIFADTLAATADQLAYDKFKPVSGELLLSDVFKIVY
jgi:hypothetical protein